MIRLLDFLIESFIGAFGITRPKPEQQGLVRLALGGVLVGSILFVLAVLLFFYFQLHGSH